MFDENSPYTLFLILVLILLSTDAESENKLDFLRTFTEQTARSVSTMQEGINTLNSGLENARSIFK